MPSRIIILLLAALAFKSAEGKTLDTTKSRDIDPLCEKCLSTMSVRSLKESLSQLTDSASAGRATGSEGAAFARAYIMDRFSALKLRAINDAYGQGFYISTKEGKLLAANVTGILPAGGAESTAIDTTKDFIVIGAHYDHLGILNGKLYPGADDNASGVAAMLELAKGLCAIKKEGGVLKYNVAFVAFDAKEHNCAGSTNLLKYNILEGEKIKFMINLDQLGTTLSPPHKSKEYLLVLGAESFKEEDIKEIILRADSQAKTGLDIDFSFYGSKTFYDLFLSTSDQYPFIKRGIPALLMTSGINEHTMKESDTERIINFPALLMRTRLVYFLICNYLL